jgi:ectoine hydroxylase-related dioxygenase (phytanoyl-CoA dioxygenase family)
MNAVMAPAASLAPDALQQGLQDIDTHGYAVHRDFITPAQCQALRERLTEQARHEREEGVATFRETAQANGRVIGRPSPGRQPVWQAITALPNKGRVFIDFIMHPLVQAYGQHIFRGNAFYLAQSTGILVRRGCAAQVMHNDQQPVPFETPMPLYFNVMLALSDFEADMGVTEAVPGTQHRPAPRLHRNPATGLVETLEQVEPVKMVCPAGSAIVFESRLWHYQGAMHSDKERVSILNGYSLHFVRAQDNYAASLQDEVYESLTDAERAMLGFEVVSQYCGRVFPRSPQDRRFNTNARYPYIPELREGGERHAAPFDGMGSDES